MRISRTFPESGFQSEAKSTRYKQMKFCVRLLILLLSILSNNALAQVPAPSMNPVTGVYATPPTDGVATHFPGVFITSTLGTATYRYTTNGTTPTPTSSTYTGPVPIVTDTILKAITIHTGTGESSPVTTSYYAVDYQAVNLPKTDLILWLRSSWPVELEGETPAHVTKWIDLTNNENHAVALADHEPILEENALNGFPVINFHREKLGQQFSLPSGSFNGLNAGLSIFAIMKPGSIQTANARLLDFGNGTTTHSVFLSQPSKGAVAFNVYNNNTPSAVTAANVIASNQYQLVEVVYNGINTATIFVNGVQRAQNTSMQAAQNITRENNYIGRATGGQHYFDGQIAEILVYRRAVSDFERQATEAYFLRRYLLSPPPSAPTISIPEGELDAPRSVAISAEPDSTIYFTNNGMSPETNGKPYQHPIDIYYSQTIKAVAKRNGALSSVSDATYVLDEGLWPAPDPGDTDAPAIDLHLPTSTE